MVGDRAQNAIGLLPQRFVLSPLFHDEIAKGAAGQVAEFVGFCFLEGIELLDETVEAFQRRLFRGKGLRQKALRLMRYGNRVVDIINTTSKRMVVPIHRCPAKLANQAHLAGV